MPGGEGRRPRGGGTEEEDRGEREGHDYPVSKRDMLSASVLKNHHAKQQQSGRRGERRPWDQQGHHQHHHHDDDSSSKGGGGDEGKEGSEEEEEESGHRHQEEEEEGEWRWCKEGKEDGLRRKVRGKAAVLVVL